MTDETDPFFLFSLDIAEDDFHALRAQQNLLVDFVQFPIKFIELLEECINNAHEDHPKYIKNRVFRFDSEVTRCIFDRFLAHLVSDPSCRYAGFNIIETNSFKHINHLSLQFLPGNDASVKEYLANLVKEFKVNSL